MKKETCTSEDLKAHADVLVRVLFVLQKSGHQDLTSDKLWDLIKKYWTVEGLQEALRAGKNKLEKFRRLLSLSASKPPPKPPGYWMIWENVEKELRVWVDEHGHFPSQRALHRERKLSLANAVASYHGGFPAARERMGCQPRTAKPYGYWAKWGHVKEEIDRWITKQGCFPTQLQLSRAGLGALVGAITAHFGGLTELKKKWNISPTKSPHGYWNWFNTEQEIRAYIEKTGDFPTDIALRRAKLSKLASAILLHGGYEVVRARMGLAARTDRKPRGYYCQWMNVERELRSVIAEVGYFPSEKELRARGMPTICDAMRKFHGGIAVVRSKLGYKVLKQNSTSVRSWEYVEEKIRSLIERLGRFPLSTEIAADSSLLHAVYRYHGGYRRVRDRLGYVPIDSDFFQANANTLARVVPALNKKLPSVTSDALFRTLKKRWSKMQLENALEDFKKRKKLTAFIALMREATQA